MSCGVEFFCEQFLKKHSGNQAPRHLSLGCAAGVTAVGESLYLSMQSGLPAPKDAAVGRLVELGPGEHCAPQGCKRRGLL